MGLTRLTHETPDQRETRLEEVSLAQQMKLTHEILDQREVHSYTAKTKLLF